MTNWRMKFVDPWRLRRRDVVMVPAFNCSRRMRQFLDPAGAGRGQYCAEPDGGEGQDGAESGADGDDVLEPDPEWQNKILVHMSNLTIFHMMAIPMP